MTPGDRRVEVALGVDDEDDMVEIVFSFEDDGELVQTISFSPADARTFAENVFRMSYEVKTQVEG